MIWQAILGVILKLTSHVTTLATTWFGGRKSAQADIKAKQAQRDLKAVIRAEEIENEVEALDRDTLIARSRKWVRSTK